jgi:tetratricopeptide (TPR) repeat protein
MKLRDIMQKLKTQQVGKNEWRFLPQNNKAIDYLEQSEEFLERGKNTMARKVLQEGITMFPNDLRLLHDLALVTEDEQASDELLLQAYELGKNSLPLNFDGKLEWGWWENRLFLRTCHIVALRLLDKGNTEEGVTLLRKMLVWNPNDNQGIREILADIYVKNKQWKEMLQLAQQYKNDCMPSITYGYALALYRTGKKEKATLKLMEAIKDLPLSAKEILKSTHKEPKSRTPGYITMGGIDQAYEFWVSQGSAWQDKEVTEWVRQALDKTKRVDQKNR